MEQLALLHPVAQVAVAVGITAIIITFLIVLFRSI